LPADVTQHARIGDVATYDHPQRYAVGVSTVVVNGEVVVDGGDHTGAVPGRGLGRRHYRRRAFVDMRRLL